MKFDLNRHNRYYAENLLEHSEKCLCRKFRDGEEMFTGERTPAPKNDPVVIKILPVAKFVEELPQQKGVKRCEHCGASLKAYWHALTPGAVSALTKLLGAVHHYGRNSIHLHGEMKAGGDPAWKLTDFEWNNFSILRFHGLAHQDEKKGNRSGYWLITARGGQFLRGEVAIPLKVKTFRNKIIEHSKQLTSIREYRNKVPYFETEFAFDYPFVVPQKINQETLFAVK